MHPFLRKDKNRINQGILKQNSGKEPLPLQKQQNIILKRFLAEAQKIYSNQSRMCWIKVAKE
jgi:hypothetical protein